MKLCIPDAGDRLKLTKSWKPTISVGYKNRNLFGQVKGENANPDDYNGEIDVNLPEGTLLEVSKYEIKNNEYKSHIKFNIFETSHEDIDPSAGYDDYVQIRVHIEEINGIEVEPANETKVKYPEITFPNFRDDAKLPKWKEPRFIKVDGKKRFKIISRTETITNEKSRRELVPTEENDEYDTLEEYYEDVGIDDYFDLDLPRPTYPKNSMLRFPAINSVFDDGSFIQEFFDNGYSDKLLKDGVDKEEVKDKVIKIKDLFEYEVVSEKYERKINVFDLYDLKKDEMVYEGYAVGSSLKSRVRKIVKEEHQNSVED